MIDAPPTGGSTGLCHESTAAIDEAVEWLLATPWENRPRPLVPFLRRRFGVEAVEACQALRESTIRHARAT